MQDMRWSKSAALLIGRLCMCVIFLLSGITKFVNFNEVSQVLTAKGLTMVPFFLSVAALIEILGGLSLLFGYKTRIWACILLLYLIPVTGIFHNFWDAEAAQKQAQLIEFLKNLTIFGGLWYVLGAGPGRFSLDALGRHHPAG